MSLHRNSYTTPPTPSRNRTSKIQVVAIEKEGDKESEREKERERDRERGREKEKEGDGESERDRERGRDRGRDIGKESENSGGDEKDFGPVLKLFAPGFKNGSFTGALRTFDHAYVQDGSHSVPPQNRTDLGGGDRGGRGKSSSFSNTSTHDISNEIQRSFKSRTVDQTLLALKMPSDSKGMIRRDASGEESLSSLLPNSANSLSAVVGIFNTIPPKVGLIPHFERRLVASDGGNLSDSQSEKSSSTHEEIHDIHGASSRDSMSSDGEIGKVRMYNNSVCGIYDIIRFNSIHYSMSASTICTNDYIYIEIVNHIL